MEQHYDISKNIFISYGHPEAFICSRIRDALENEGYRVWFDESEIKHGDDWREKIASGITNSGNVLAMLSKHSVRNPGVCLNELSIAVGVKHGSILTVPPASITHNQWLDMSSWEERYNQDPSAFEPWFDSCMQDLLAVLRSPQTKRFAGDIDFIRKKLPSISLSTSKQSALLSKPFVGRKWLTEQVDNYIDSENTSNICILFGDPGIGKSAFAAHYTHYNARVAAAIFCEYEHTHFNNPLSVIQTLAFLLACRIPSYRIILRDVLDSNSPRDYNDSELFDFLLANPLSYGAIDSENMAIIIDGLDECGEAEQNHLAEILINYSDRLPRWLKILALSRDVQGVRAPIGGNDTLQLNGNDRNNTEDIKEYFRIQLKEKLEKLDNAEEILETLSKRSGGIFLYAAMISTGILKDKLDITREDEYPTGLNETFLRWFRWFFPNHEEYKNDFLSPLCAILASPEPLPGEEIKHIFNLKNTKYNDFISRIDVLLQHGKNDFDKESISFNHRYISEWLLSKEAGIYRADKEVGIETMAQAFYNRFCEDPSNLTAYEVLHILPFLQSAQKRKQYDSVCKNTALTEKLLEYGKWCYDWGKIETALTCFSQYKAIVENLKIENPSYDNLYSLSIGYQAIGTIKNNLGKYNEALELYRKALDIAKKLADERCLQDDLHNLASMYEYVANMLNEQGKLTEALELYSEFLVIKQQVADEHGLPDDLCDLAYSYQHVANVLEKQCNFTKALDLYIRSLDIAKKVADERGLLEDFRDLAYSYQYVANMLEKQGNVTEALDLYMKSLDIAKKVADERGLLEDFRDLAYSHQNVANMLVKQSNFTEAFDLYTKSLDIAKKVADERGLPEDWRFLSDNYYYFADMLEEQGNFTEAIYLYMKSLDIAKKIADERGLPEDIHLLDYRYRWIKYTFFAHSTSTEVLDPYNISNKTYTHFANSYLDAVTKQVAESSKPNNLRNLASRYCEAADILETQENFIEALELYKKSLDILKKLADDQGLPIDLHNLSYCFGKIGNVFKKQDNLAKALELHRESLNIARKLTDERGLPDDLHFLSIHCKNVADILMDQNNSGEASELYRESLNIARKLADERGLPDDLRFLSEHCDNVAAILIEQNNFDEAFDLYIESLNIVKRLADESGLPDDLRDLSDKYDKVADIFKKHGNSSKALVLYSEGLKFNKNLSEKHSFQLDFQRLVSYCDNVADILERMDNPAEALDVYEDFLNAATKLADERGAFDDLHKLSLRNNEVANTLKNRGYLAESLTLYKISLDIRQKLVAKRGKPIDFHSLAISYDNVTDILEEQGDFTKVLALHMKSLDHAKKIADERGLPNDLRLLSNRYYFVADALLNQGNSTEAFVLYRNSLDITKKLADDHGLSKDIRAIFKLYNRFADKFEHRYIIFLDSKSKLPSILTETLDPYKYSLVIAEKLSEERGLLNHLRNLSFRNNRVAHILGILGFPIESIDLYRISLNIRKKLVAESSSLVDLRNLAISYNIVADLFKEQDNSIEAIALYKESLSIAKRVADERGFPKDLYELAIIYGKVADVLVKQDNFTEALDLYKASLAIREKLADENTMPEKLHSLPICYNRIANILKKQGKLTEALDLNRKALDIAKRLVDEDSAGIESYDFDILPASIGPKKWKRNLKIYILSISFRKVADILKEQGNLTEALNLYKESLDIAKKLADEYSNDRILRNLAIINAKVAEIHEEQNNLIEALTFYMAALDSRIRLFDNQHDDLSEEDDEYICYLRVTLYLNEKGQSAEVIGYLKRAFRIARNWALPCPQYKGDAMIIFRLLDVLIKIYPPSDPPKPLTSSLRRFLRKLFKRR